jgi:mannose-6-phosphate isomerase-like protein (cupin superfamily)
MADSIQFRKVEDVEEAPNPHNVSARKMHASEHAVIMHLALQPGEALHPHITPVDVVFYVLEGTGLVEIGDEQLEAGPDTLVESPKDIPHRLVNESDSVFRVLVIKTPRPTSETKLL